MRIRIAIAWLSLAVALLDQSPGRSASAPMATGTATIAGTVFAGSGNDPGRKTRVMLASLDPAIPGQTVSTDDEGRFEFRNVPAGRFRIDAQKAGFLRASYGATRPNRLGTPVSVAEGSQTDGLTIRLVHGAAISGTVRSAVGRPMPGISVSAMRANYSVLGERQFTTEANGTTDDQGAYRVWGLQPGEYLIVAIPGVPGGFGSAGNDFGVLTAPDVDRVLQGGPEPFTVLRQTSPTSTYSPVFAPATTDASLAAPISISASEDREGVDVVLGLVRTARIDGVVTRRDGLPLATTTITLVGSGGAANLLVGNRGFQSRTATVDGQGRFTFFEVRAGGYRVLASTAPLPATGSAAESPSMWAASEIAVNGTDVAVSLSLQPSMTVSGRVVFNGSSQPPDDPTLLSVRLAPLGGGANSGPLVGSVGADRAFSVRGVTPGDYRIQTATRSQWPARWFLRSATFDGNDVLDGSLGISQATTTELVLTFSDRPTEISGQFTESGGLPATDYFIVVFPADREQWQPGSRRILSTRPGNDGRYSVRGLPPGNYLLAALTDLDPQDLFATSFFDQLVPLAVRMTLSEGQSIRQDLSVRGK